MKAKVAIICSVAASMVLLAACSGSAGKTEIDLDDYVVVNFEGYDGIGSARAEIDYEAIEKDYGNKIKINRSKEDELPGASDNVFQYIEAYTGVSVTPDSELSNGDNIKLVWDVDENFFDEYLNCTFLYSDRTFEVSGLEEVSTVDVFDGVDVLFSGVAPVGKAEISVNNNHNPKRYTLDQDSDLSNGDVVTVTYNIDEEDIDQFMEDFIADFGGAPDSTSKEYTVYGLDSYIVDMSQLSEDNLNELKEDARAKTEDMFTSEAEYSIASESGIANWSQERGVEHGDDYVLENIYFLSPKEPGQSSIVYVYSVSATITFEDAINDYIGAYREPEAVRIYYPVVYSDLIQEEDGSLVGVSNGECDRYKAAGDMDSLYEEYVSGTKDDYVATVYDADLNIVK